MGKQFESMLPEHREFISKQVMYFVGSAPLSADGHVNLSPKGHDSLRVLTPNRVAYLDMTGSGNETSAHILENGRITVMFCAFQGAPNILRLYGKGAVVLPDTKEWNELYPLFDPLPGSRQIIVVEVELVQTSCGYSVPFMAYEKDRDSLKKYALTKGEEGMVEYRREKNVRSIDGMPTPIGIAFADQENAKSNIGYNGVKE